MFFPPKSQCPLFFFLTMPRCQWEGGTFCLIFAIIFSLILCHTAFTGVVWPPDSFWPPTHTSDFLPVLQAIGPGLTFLVGCFLKPVLRDRPNHLTLSLFYGGEIHTTSFNPFTTNSSVAFCAFIMLCNHHLFYFQNIFIVPLNFTFWAPAFLSCCI